MCSSASQSDDSVGAAASHSSRLSQLGFGFADEPWPYLTVQASSARDYRLDLEHSRIGFIARHAMVTSVRGAFAEFEGTAHLDSAHPVNSSAEICVEVTSLSRPPVG